MKRKIKEFILNPCKIEGITNEHPKSLGINALQIHTFIFVENIKIKCKFNIVEYDLPIAADEILDKHFISKYKCNLNHRYWTFALLINQNEVCNYTNSR